jgi:hypothetical protein
MANIDINMYRNLIDDFLSEESFIQTGEEGYLQNRIALEYLQNQESIWKNVVSFSTTISAGTFLIIYIPLITLVASLIVTVSLEFLARVGRLCAVIEVLLDHFGDDGIIITPRIKTTEGIIDLLVKMPDRRTFAFMLRSKGESLVKWREDRQEFFVSSNRRKGKKSLTKWDELTKLNKKLAKMTLTVKHEHPTLVGTSNTERNKLIVKAMILTSKTSIDPENDPSLLVNFGRAEVLKVKLDAVSYVVNKDDLTKFLHAPEK